MTILCDFDGVIADMLPAWVARYNEDYNDTLRPDAVDQWDMVPFVKPECGTKIFSYLHDPRLYHDVLPMAGALAGIEGLRARDNRVLIVTACVNDLMVSAKIMWLQTHGFFPDMRSTMADLLIVPSKEKWRVAGEVMIDDYDQNLKGFDGQRILFDTPYNRKTDVGHQRATTWRDILNLIGP